MSFEKSKDFSTDDLMGLTNFIGYNGWEETSYQYYDSLKDPMVPSGMKYGLTVYETRKSEEAVLKIYTMVKRISTRDLNQVKYRIYVEIDDFTDINNSEDKESRAIDYIVDNEIPLYLDGSSFEPELM